MKANIHIYALLAAAFRSLALASGSSSWANSGAASPVLRLSVREWVVWGAVALLVVFVSLLVALFIVLRQRNRHLRQMQEERIEREKYITTVSHEFRTPLTLIVGLAQRIRQDQISEEESPAQLATVIVRQGSNMLQLLNRLLDIAHAQRMKEPAEMCRGNIVAHIHMAVEAVDEYAQRKHISLQYVPEQTHVDMPFQSDAVQKIIEQILLGAIAESPEYGPIRISSELVQGHESFRLRVRYDCLPPEPSDSETAPPAAEREELRQAPLLQQLLVATHATLQMEEPAPEKRIVQLDWPYEQSRSDTSVGVRAAALPEKSIEASGEGATVQHSILVVEDNADIYYYIECILKKEPYTLYHACHGEDGLEKAKAIMPDLIIADVMMPVMDGFEMSKALKESPLTNHIPVIIVSARHSDADKLQGFESGVVCYLSKPFRPGALLRLVHNIFEQQEAWQTRIMEQLQHQTDEPHHIQGLSATDTAFLLKINHYILAHMEKGGMTVEQLAQHMCMSSKQLNRKLSNLAGYNIKAYIQRQCVLRACKLLEMTEERINIIGLKCGFDNPSNFSRTFKESMGCSPSDWRVAALARK